MTTRPTLDSTPEDASLAKWTRDVEGFVEDLIGNNKLPSAPAEVKVVSQANSVKVTFRAVNEVGVSEYKVYRSTDKNFTGENAEHIATVTQAIDPSSTDIVYIDAQATEKSFYFVSAVKGLRRPRLEGPVAGFGSATEGHEIGEGNAGGGTISGFSGIPGSILFVNEDSLVDQDNENLFYSQAFKAMVVGNSGLMWGPQKSPDVVLIRDAADTLAQRRGTNPQEFNLYNTFVSATDNELGEIGFIPVADVFVIGTKKGSGGGTARPLVIRTDETEVLRFGVSGAAVSSVLHSHPFTSDGSGIDAALHKLSGTLTGASGDTGTLFGMDVDPTIVTQAATEDIADIASLNVKEPKITDNLTGNIGIASTLRIAGAPTEGNTANWSLNVVSGASIFGGTLHTFARIKTPTRVTGTYTILVTDSVVFANTDSTAYTATLPAGVSGQTFKIINAGSSGNNLTVAPNGSEDLLGVNSNFILSDGETLALTYDTIDGWY